MKKVSVFLAEGFEEVEGLTAVDLLRRAGAEVTMAAVGDSLEVTGSHGICVKADRFLNPEEERKADLLVLPGGQPGTKNLNGCSVLLELLKEFDREEKKLAAICAAPTVLGSAGLLEGRKATCYPGCEGGLKGAKICKERVAADGHITTSRGVGTAIPFALSLIEQLYGKEKAEEIRKSIIYGHDA